MKMTVAYKAQNNNSTNLINFGSEQMVEHIVIIYNS